MKKIKIEIDENKKITSYCIIGDLPEGVEVEVADDFEFNAVDEYFLENDIIVKKINLDKLKNQKREALKKIRHDKIQANIEIHGSVFQVRDEDKENFDDVGLMIRTGEIDYSYTKHWVLADNSIKAFTAEQIIDVWKERTKRKDQIFLEFGQLSQALAKAETLEEIEAVKWDF